MATREQAADAALLTALDRAGLLADKSAGGVNTRDAVMAALFDQGFDVVLIGDIATDYELARRDEATSEGTSGAV